MSGFDAPSLHTRYLDKPMQSHGLMQAIARVNRVFKDKPGGLVVDDLGLANNLRQALETYTESGGTGRTAVDKKEAMAVMLEKHEVRCALFHGFGWSKWTTGAAQERLGLLPAAQEDGKDRCLAAVREPSLVLQSQILVEMSESALVMAVAGPSLEAPSRWRRRQR